MMRNRFGLTIAGAVSMLVIAACSGSISDAGGELLRTFSGAQQDTMVTERAAVRAELRDLFVDASFVSPTPCVTLQPVWKKQDSDVTLTVTAVASGGVCPAVLGYFKYSSIAGQLSRGTYRVRIIHKDTSGSRTVFDSSLAITF